MRNQREFSEGEWSTTEVAELTGISVRRLDHWVRSGHVRPRGGRGSGDWRLWIQEDIDRAVEIRDTYSAVCKLLTNAGLPPIFTGRRRRVLQDASQE